MRHKWGLTLQVVKARNHFKSKKTPSPIQQATSPLSAACGCETHSTAEFAESLRKPPQAPPREKVIEKSGSQPGEALLAPSLMCEEIQRALGGTPFGDDQRPSKAPLIRQEGRLPSQILTHNWQSGTVGWAERGSLQPKTSNGQDPRQEGRVESSLTRPLPLGIFEGQRGQGDRQQSSWEPMCQHSLKT